MTSSTLAELRLLLVEDELTMLMLARASLKEMADFKIVEAKDGKEALAFLHKDKDIDLIISDWNMPNVTGIELLRAARKLKPGIPFIMVTANATPECINDALEAGVDVYLAKPYSIQQLKTRVMKVLEKHFDLSD